MIDIDFGDLHEATISALKKPEKRFMFFEDISQDDKIRFFEVREYKKILQNELQITRKFLVEDGVVEEAFYSPDIQRLMSIRHLKEPFDDLELPLFLQLQRDAVEAVRNFRLPFKRCWLEFSSEKYNHLVAMDPSMDSLLNSGQKAENASRLDGDIHHSLNAWPLQNPDNREEKWLYEPKVIGQYMADLEQTRGKGNPGATGFKIQTFSGGIGSMSDVPLDAETRKDLGCKVVPIRSEKVFGMTGLEQARQQGWWKGDPVFTWDRDKKHSHSGMHFDIPVPKKFANNLLPEYEEILQGVSFDAMDWFYVQPQDDIEDGWFLGEWFAPFAQRLTMKIIEILNYPFIETKPASLNRNQGSKGKRPNIKPFDSYYRCKILLPKPDGVEIKQPPCRDEAYGKRLHQVRGHWRIYKDEFGEIKRKTWIREHRRGDAKLGVVLKDYHLTTETNNADPD